MTAINIVVFIAGIALVYTGYRAGVWHERQRDKRNKAEAGAKP